MKGWKPRMGEFVSWAKQRFWSGIPVFRFCATLGLLGVACTTPASSAGPGTARAPSPAAAAPTASPAASVESPLETLASDAGPSASAAGASARRDCPPVPPIADVGTPCGELNCLAFDSAAAAFAHVLKAQPRVIGVGESHAQKGMESIVPTTRRFAEELLPRLCGRTRSLILEVWLPRNDCGDQRVQQVEKQQKPVTSTQAKSNKDDYVALGYAAKRIGIEPSALVPTCDEYQSILDAGPDGIERMLSLVGSKTAERVLEELRRVPESVTGPAVVAYGGALHNDSEPTPAYQAFSYGPRLLRETKGRYIELDLVVREYVKDTDAWRKQPYYQALRNSSLPDKALLYQWAEHSFGIVFAAGSRSKD